MKKEEVKVALRTNAGGEVFLRVVRLSKEIKSDSVGRMCSGRVILGMTDGY